MTSLRWIALGALWIGLAVLLGASGAHAMKERLVASGHLANWETAVRYQAWHGLGLIVVGTLHRGSAPPTSICGLLFAGSLLCSGSIYGLALDGPGAVLGPLTPLGGALMIAGWFVLAFKAWRAR